MHFEAASRRAQREHQARAWLAWHTAALSGMAFAGKRLPPLEKLTGPAKPRKRQDWQDIKHMALMVNAMHGGDVIERKPE